MGISRRDFISRSIATTAALGAGLDTSGGNSTSPGRMVYGERAYPISIFSKALHWLDYESMAKAVSGIGFDGIDLTVRPDGHVTPENVQSDLPKVHKILSDAGIRIDMVTTSILSAEDKYTEPILKAASAAGIKHYRMGWIQYDNATTIEENLKKIQKQLQALEKLNRKYKIVGEYQNHSGTFFGASIWDLHQVLNAIDSPWLGVQYDIMHAIVEAANSWPTGLKLIKPFIKTLDVKDFTWDIQNNKAKRQGVPLGKGLVDFNKYLSMVKELSIQAPVSIHYEYSLGGAENGAKTITMKSEEVLESIKQDLVAFKSMIKEKGLVM